MARDVVGIKFACCGNRIAWGGVLRVPGNGGRIQNTDLGLSWNKMGANDQKAKMMISGAKVLPDDCADGLRQQLVGGLVAKPGAGWVTGVNHLKRVGCSECCCLKTLLVGE